MTYLLVILGSTVRVTESGMGCPGWPLCYGALGPIDRFHALLEQSHRYLAAVVTLLVIATAVAALQQRPPTPARRPAVTAVAVIVVQIALGAITVFTHNAPPTVAAHLLTGLLLLSVVTVTAVAAWVARRPSTGRRLTPLAGWAVGGVLTLLVSGSLVVDGGAARSCPAWPGCPTTGVPTPLLTLNLLHRGVATLAGLLVLAFAVHVWRHWANLPAARPLAATLTGLLLLAGGIGAGTAVLRAPAGWQDAHLAAAATVLVVVVALTALGWYAAADSPHSPQNPDADASTQLQFETEKRYVG